MTYHPYKVHETLDPISVLLLPSINRMAASLKYRALKMHVQPNESRDIQQRDTLSMGGHVLPLPMDKTDEWDVLSYANEYTNDKGWRDKVAKKGRTMISKQGI